MVSVEQGLLISTLKSGPSIDLGSCWTFSLTAPALLYVQAHTQQGSY